MSLLPSPQPEPEQQTQVHLTVIAGYASFMDRLSSARERALDNAALRSGETVLDVGCGDGLIAFGALDRDAGLVVLSDVSSSLIETCRSIAVNLDVVDTCRFVVAPAERLDGVDDSSVDVVTTRSHSASSTGSYGRAVGSRSSSREGRLSPA